jgi:hypothetical protein
MKDLLRPALLSAVLLLPLAGCDKATPVAPDGTTLAISANPSSVGLNGTSTITVIGRRPNGSPLVPGTEIQFTTNLGRIDPLIATTDSSGQATAIFRADNRAGSATVTASAGTSSSSPSPSPSPTPTTGTSISQISDAATGGVSVSTTIQVGATDSTRPTLLLSVNPSTVAVNSSATVTVIARNSDGSAVAAGQQVILTTTLGSLSPTRPTTRSDGTATSTLTTGAQSGTATVTAVLGSSAAATATVEIRDAILELTANPNSIPETGGQITLTAHVFSFQGTNLADRTVTFHADRGTLSASTARTTTEGVATVTLTVPAENVSSNITFQVTATTPSGSGQPLSQTVTITIRDINNQ